MKMYTAFPLVMIYLPTKFEGDLLKNKGDIAEPIQAVKKEKEKELELNLSGNPTGRSPSSPEKKFLRCVEVKVIRRMSGAMC